MKIYTKTNLKFDKQDFALKKSLNIKEKRLKCGPLKIEICKQENNIT